MLEPAAPAAALPVAHGPNFILGQTPMGETNLAVVFEALASELDYEDKLEKAECFRLLNRVVQQRTDFRTVRDIKALSVDRNMIHRLLAMAGLTAGLAVRFARALDPTEEEGFEWPAPANGTIEPRCPGKKTGPKPGAFNWSTEPKFPRTTLAPHMAVPSLRENGVFDDIPQPMPGQHLSDRRGFTIINQRIYNLAQSHPNLQGGGLELRASIAWTNELREFCPLDRMPVLQTGKKAGQRRMWNLSRAFANRRNNT